MGRPADIIIAGCKVRPAELQHIALGIGVDETVSLARIVEFMDMARRESQAGKQLLCESAVILQPVAEGASADDLEAIRSEEHTSELQSLMRISYAVFCLKKKKKTT